MRNSAPRCENDSNHRSQTQFNTAYNATLSGSSVGAFGSATITGGTGILRGISPAVPEPGTWALMLLGFGAVGVSMRRRRQVGAIAQLA